MRIKKFESVEEQMDHILKLLFKNHTIISFSRLYFKIYLHDFGNVDYLQVFKS